MQQVRPDWQVEVYSPKDVKVLVDAAGHIQGVRGVDFNDADVVVMQRAGRAHMLDLIDKLHSSGTAVVLDADDALWAIHRRNAAYAAWNNPGQHWRRMDAAAKVCDLMTVTTSRLAERYGRHGRCEVLPNRVPGWALDAEPGTPAEPPAGLTIGWSGFVATHPLDLHVMAGAVAELLDTHPTLEARIIGNSDGIAGAWELDSRPELADRVKATGGLHISRYFGGLSLLDVGLVPLEDSTFNKAKSGLKMAEYAARGVPAVATPTAANRLLAREGYPVLWATSPREWVEQVGRLLEGEEERLAMGAAARDAAERHTLEAHAEEWAVAWERAALRRTRLSA